MKHVPVELSSAQVRALKKGGAIIMKPSMLVEGGKHSLALSEPTIKKLMNAMKKGKGMRMMLDETVGEGIMGAGYHVPSGQKKGEKHGGKHVGFAVKSMVGDGHQGRKDREDERLAMEVHDLKKGRGHQGEKDREDEKLAMEIHDLKHGGSNPFTKAAKSVSKGAKKATKSVSKGAKKASKAAGKAAKSAGKAAKKGAKAAGKAAKDVSKSPEFQALAKAALEEGGKMAGTAIGAELGDPELGTAIGSTLGRVGSDQVGVKSKDRTSQLASSTLREGSAAAERSGLAASHPLSTALARRVVERKMGEGLRSYSARMILPASDEMTLSPFARVNSAQMSPYIHASPQLARRIIRGNGMHGMGMHGMGMHYGMGINPAGQHGGGIFPPGHHGGGIFPPGHQGGSIYPSGSSVHTIGQGHRGLMHGGLIYNPDNDPMLERQNRRIRATMNRMRGRGINPAGV